jgi:hypothetical protein
METTRGSLTSLAIDIPLLDALHNYGKINNIIKMGPLPFLSSIFNIPSQPYRIRVRFFACFNPKLMLCFWTLYDLL